jgi:uncharacterized protein YdaU (DUF1376 family)
MQLYVGDYLADTTDLTTEQHGAYLLLLMTMWRHGAKLPNDPSKLARIARVSPRRWPQIWAEIERFFSSDAETIQSPRLTKEYEKAVSISQKRSASGAKGGAAKALKNNDTGLANASGLPKHSQKSDIIKSRDTNVSQSSGDDPPPPNTNDLSDALAIYTAAAEESGWPKIRDFSASRRSALSARLKGAGGLDGWRAAVERAQKSDHCCGGNSRGWVINFDFITSKNGFNKLMEGNYDNRTHGNGRSQSGFVPDAAHPGGGGQVTSLAGLVARREADRRLSAQRAGGDVQREHPGLLGCVPTGR